MQRGSGLGQLLVNAAKTVIPFITKVGTKVVKPVAKTISQRAASTVLKKAASKAVTLAKDKNTLKAIGGTAATALIGELGNLVNKKRKAPPKKQPPSKKPRQLAIEAPPAKFQTNQRKKTKGSRRKKTTFKTIFD